LSLKLRHMGGMAIGHKRLGQAALRDSDTPARRPPHLDRTVGGACRLGRSVQRTSGR